MLKKASEIDEAEPPAPGRGLALSELEDIAREVGISGEAIAKAVAELERPGGSGPSLKGAPLVRRAVRAVAGELDQAAIARLIQVVDERTDSAGTVSEALGSVRWTSSERFKSTQVSIRPREGETTIQVVEKAVPRLRRLVHLLPAAWGAMLVTPLLGTMDLTDAGTIVVAALALAVGAGLGAGRLVWNVMSEASERRVKRLASELSDEARAE